jgi:hypothetical protein
VTFTGAGGRKARKARATGAGTDSEVARAQAFDDWQSGADLAESILACGAATDATARANIAAMEQDLAELRDKRAAIVQSVLAESSDGNRILALAGGAGYGTGKRVVTMQSSGMAARAGRYVKSGGRAVVHGGKVHFKGRGIEPSETSLQDAAADAAMWAEWLVLTSLWPCEWNSHSLCRLGAVGWRAAFKSFRKDATEGRTGNRADEPAIAGDCVPLERATLHVEQESRPPDIAFTKFANFRAFFTI